MSTLKLIRRTVQFSVAGIFILIPWLNANKFHDISGNFLSFDFYGIPFTDPLAALQSFTASGSISSTLLFGAFLPVILASFLGAVFCSWICPYGLISELNQSLNRKVRGVTIRKRANGFKTKIIFFGMILAAMALLGGTPILNQFSMPGWYSRAFQSWFLQGVVPAGAFLLLAAMAVDLISGQRFWCRYCCPQSIILHIVQSRSPKRLRIVFDPTQCTCDKESPCRSACPLSLNPKGSQNILELECSNCGDCATECAQHGGAIRQVIARKP